jgi:hypothetical protein
MSDVHVWEDVDGSYYAECATCGWVSDNFSKKYDAVNQLTLHTEVPHLKARP